MEYVIGFGVGFGGGIVFILLSGLVIYRLMSIDSLAESQQVVDRKYKAMKRNAKNMTLSKVQYHSQLTPEERKEMDDTVFQKLKNKIFLPAKEKDDL